MNKSILCFFFPLSHTLLAPFIHIRTILLLPFIHPRFLPFPSKSIPFPTEVHPLLSSSFKNSNSVFTLILLMELTKTYPDGTTPTIAVIGAG